MTDLLVTANLMPRTAKPEDVVVNNFAFRSFASGADPEEMADDCFDVLDGLYKGQIGATGRRVETYISGSVLEYDFFAYDITNALGINPATGRPYNHGSPIAARQAVPRIVANASGSSLPAEVAAVVTLKALGRDEAPVEVADGEDLDAAVDRPRQRRTGRFYLGPLTTSAINSTNATFDAHIAEVFRGDVLTKCIDVFDVFAWSTTTQPRLCVWSRKDGVMRPVESFHMDNACDTIRGRGRDATITSGLQFGGGWA